VRQVQEPAQEQQQQPSPEQKPTEPPLPEVQVAETQAPEVAEAPLDIMPRIPSRACQGDYFCDTVQEIKSALGH